MRWLFLVFMACASAVTPTSPVRVFSGPAQVRQPYKELKRIQAKDTNGRYDDMLKRLVAQAQTAGADGLILEDMTDKHGRFESVSGVAVRLIGKESAEAPLPIVEPSESHQVRRLEKLCKKGFLPSCVALGSALQDGREVPKDFTRAADLFEAACFKGYTLACTHYGFAFYQGLGRPQSDTDAIVNFKSSCDAGDVGGCRYLGVLYSTSANTAATYSRPFFRQACDGNDSWSCWRLARMMQVGEAGDKGTPEEVADLFHRACILGAEQACYVEPSTLPILGERE